MKQLDEVVTIGYPYVMTHYKSYPMCDSTYQCTHHGKLIMMVKISNPFNQEMVDYSL